MRLCFVLVALALSGSVGQQALQPHDEPAPVQMASETVNSRSEATVLHIQQAASSQTPSAAQCFLILAASFAIVNLILFVTQQIKYAQGKYFPAEEETTETKSAGQLIEFLDESTINNVKAALSFAPTVALLMLFILFRAENHSIDRSSNSDYTTAQTGMWIATFGIVVLAVDGFLVSVSSELLSRIIEGMGTLMTYLGYILLLVGLVVARNSVVPFSTAENCILALAILLITSMVGLKLIQIKDRILPTLSAPLNMEKVTEFINETTLEQIRSVCEFVPVLITAFFYLHFYYVNLGEVPDAAVVGMTASTFGVYIQVVAVFLKLVHESFAILVTAIGVLVTYIFFAVTMYAAVDAGWPPTSIAVEFTLILLFLLAFLKLIIVITQELARGMLGADTSEDSEVAQNFARLMKLFKDMMSTTGNALILCAFFLYFHFRAQFLLHVEPDTYIKGIGGLVELMYLAVVCLFIQMMVQLLEIGIGPNMVMSLAQFVAVTGVNVGLAGITIAAISN